MSSTTDERIVKLQLDNKEFEKNAKETIKTTDELKEAMKFKNSTEALEAFSKQLTNIEKSTSAAESAMTKMSKYSTTIFGQMLSSIKGKVSSTLLSIPTTIFKNVTTPIREAFAQIESGGWSRASNIKEAQFQLKGLGVTGAKLAKVMEDVNYGVSGTAYGLDAAAKAASQLTASGVTAGDSMKAALRGISGVAAMTNSTYEDISSIFTTVAGNGKLMTQQLRQFSFRGLNAAATLGQQLGKTEAEINQMVSKGQIDFATFSKAMDDAFGEHAKDANETYTGSLANMKAALSRIGADVAAAKLETMVGVFNACRQAINSLHVQFQPLIDTFASFERIKNNALQGLIESFTELDANGNRVMHTGLRLSEMAEGMSRIMWNFRSIMFQIQLGLRDVLGDSNPLVKVVGALSGGINSLSKATEPSVETLVRIRKGVSLLFTPLAKLNEALGWVKDKASDVIEFIKNSSVAQSVLASFDKPISKFNSGVAVLKTSISGLSNGNKNFDTISKSATKLVTKLKNLASQSKALNAIKDTLSKFSFNGVLDKLSGGLKKLIELLSKLGSAITSSKIWTNLKPFATNVLGVVDSAIASIVTNGGNLFSTIKRNGGVLSSIGKIISNIKTAVMSIAPYISKGVEKVGSLAASLLGFKEAVEPVNEALQMTTTIVDAPVALAGPNSTVGQVLQLTETVDENIGKKGLIDRLKDFGSAIYDMFKSMGTGYKQNEAAIQNGFNILKSITWYLVGFITWRSIIKQVNAVTKVMNSATGMLDNIGIAFKTFADKIQHPFSNITNITNNIKNVGANTPVLLQLSAVILSITAAVELLGRMDRTDLIEGAVAIGVLTSVMGAIAILLKVVTVKVIPAGQQFKSSGVAMTITALALSMLTIAGAIKMLENVNMSGGIIDNLIVLGGTLTVLGGVTAAMSKFSGTHQLKSAVVVMTLALALRSLCKTLTQLAEDLDGISWNTMWKSFAALAAAVVSVGTIGLLMSKVAFGGAVGLIAIILAASRIADIVNNLLMNLDWDAVKAKVVEYQDVLLDIAKLGAIFAVVAYMLGPNIDKFSNGIVKLAVSVSLMAVLGRVLKGMEDGDINHALIMFRETAAMLGLLLMEMAAIQFFVGSIDYKGINKVIKQITRFFLSMTVLTVLIGLIPEKIFNKGTIGLVEFAGMLAVLELCSLAAKGVDAKTLKAIAVNLVVMLTSLLVIAFIPWEMLKKGLISIGVMCLSLAAVFLSLKNIKKSYDKSVWKVLGMAIVGLVAIAGSLYFLSTIPTVDIIKAAGALVVTFVVLGSVFKSLLSIRHNANNILKVRDTFLMALGLLGSITAAIWALSLADTVGLITGMVALNATLLVLTKCIETLFSINYNKNRLKMVGNIVLLAAGLLASIAISLRIAAGAGDWKSMLAAGVAMSGVLVAFTTVFKLMTGLGGDATKALVNSAAIILAGGVLFEIAAALKIVASIGDAGLILSAMLAIDGVLVAFGIVLATMSVLGTNVTGAMAGAGSLVLAGVALFEIATSLWMVAQAGDFTQLIGAMLAIDGVLVALGAVLAVMTILGTNVVGALAGAGSLILAGLVLFEIGAVLGNLAQYDWMNLKAACESVNKTLLVLTAVLAVMSLLGPLAIVGAACLDAVALVLGVGLIAILEIIGYLYSQSDYIEQGLTFLKTIGSGIGEAIGNFIASLVASSMEQLNQAASDLVEFGEKFAVFVSELNIIKAMDPDWSVVGDMLDSIAEMTKTGILSSIGEFFGSNNSLSSSLDEFGKAVSKLASIVGETNKTALINGMTVIKQLEADLDAISALADKFSDTSNITNFAAQMKNFGDLGIAEFTNSLANADVSTPITNLFTAIQNAVVLNKTVAVNAFQQLGSDLTSAIDAFYTNFYESGVYLIEGLTAGLADETAISSLKSTVSSLGDNVDSTFRDIMQIHSPSVRMQEDGKYVVQGLANGIGNNGTVVVSSISQLSDKVDTATMKELYAITKHIKKEGSKNIDYVYDETNKKVMSKADSLFSNIDTEANEGFDKLKETVGDEIKSMDFGQYSSLIEGKLDLITSIFSVKGEAAGKNFIKSLKASLMSGDSWDTALSNAAKDAGLDLSSISNALTSVGDSADETSDALDNYSSSAGGAGKSSSDAAEKANILAQYNWIVAKSTGAVNSAFGIMANEIDGANTAASTFGTNFDQVAEVMYKASRTGSEAFEDMFSKTGAGLDDFRSKVVETFKSILDSFEDTFDMMSSASNPFDGMLSGKQMIRNLQDQATQVASVGVKLTRLAMKDVNSQLLQELASGGASSLTQINSLLRASAEEIQEINALYLQKSSVAQISAIQSVNAMAIAAQRDIYEAQAATGDATAAILLQYSTLESDAIEYINEYVDRFEYASSTIREVVANGINTFEEFDFTVEKSAADFVKNMWSQVEGARQWEANLEKIMAMGASDELINALVQKGQDGGFEIAAALAMGTAEQIASANAAMIAQKNIPDELASKFGDAYALAGSASADKFVEDFAKLLAMDPNGDILEATGIMAKTTNQELQSFLLNGGKDGVSIKSVCTRFLGEMAAQVRSKTNIPANSAENMGKETVEAVEKNVNANTGKQEGDWFLQGLANSVGPNSTYGQMAIAQALATAQAVAAALHSGLGNGSPSKIAKQEGIWFEQGLVNGLRSMADKVDSTAEEVNNPVVDALQEAMARSTAILQNSDMNPVIKPVLDLSEIQNGSNLLANMLPSAFPATGIMAGMTFGGGLTQNVGATIRDAVKEGLSGMKFNNNVSFNQVNNSPKALDRDEIYRQTNSQISRLKEALR